MVAIADIPKERLKAIRQAYHRVHKRAYAKERYMAKKEESRQGGLANVRFKEERPNTAVTYCQCGCGKKLDGHRYLPHYQTRECFIHCFHKDYHK